MTLKQLRALVYLIGAAKLRPSFLFIMNEECSMYHLYDAPYNAKCGFCGATIPRDEWGMINALSPDWHLCAERLEMVKEEEGEIIKEAKRAYAKLKQKEDLRSRLEAFVDKYNLRPILEEEG